MGEPMPSLSEAMEDMAWDVYRRRRDSGRLDDDYLAWCARQGRDPQDAQSARGYEDWFVENAMDDESSWSWWREQGYGA